MSRLANAFDLLGEDSSDVRRLVAIVDAKADASFLAAEKKSKEEAKEAERKKEEKRQQRKKKTAEKRIRPVPPQGFHRGSPAILEQGHEGHVPVVKQKWVPKSELQSESQNDSSDQIQGTQEEEAKNKIQYVNHHGHYQQRRGRGRGHGGYQNQGTRNGSHSDHNNLPEKEKETKGGAGEHVKEEVVDNNKQVQEQEEEGVNNGGDGGSSNKSVDGKRRQNKNGSLRRKMKKKKAAAGGEKKELGGEE